MKFLSGGGIGGMSGNTDLRGWDHFLPHISLHSILEVDTAEGINKPLPWVTYSTNGIEDIPIFDNTENPPLIA